MKEMDCRRRANEEMEGVMDYLRQMDRRLREISDKVEELEEERKRERIPRRYMSQESSSSDDSSKHAWELRDGSWFLRIGPKRMNSRQRRKIWRSVKISMEVDEKEREMRKNAHESRKVRSNLFRPGRGSPGRKMGNAKGDDGRDRGDGNRSKGGVCNKRVRNPDWFHSDQTQDRQCNFPVHCDMSCDPSSSSGNRRFM